MPPRKINKILIKDDYAVILCSSKHFGIFEVKIDIEDIEKIKKYYWRIREDKRSLKHYVETFDKGIRIHLHRYIMGFDWFSRTKTIDHINGDATDNRKNNLRVCTHRENMQNIKLTKRSSSGIRYISKCNTTNKWKVVFKGKYLKSFNNLNEAKAFLNKYLSCLNKYS